MADFGNSEDSLTTDDEILKYLEVRSENIILRTGAMHLRKRQ